MSLWGSFALKPPHTFLFYLYHGIFLGSYIFIAYRCVSVWVSGLSTTCMLCLWKPEEEAVRSPGTRGVYKWWWTTWRGADPESSARALCVLNSCVTSPTLIEMYVYAMRYSYEFSFIENLIEVDVRWACMNLTWWPHSFTTDNVGIKIFPASEQD